MSAAELAEWQAYYIHEPFGESWRQASYVCSMIGNGSGGKKHGGSFKPTDFMPVKQPLNRGKRMSGEQMLAIFRAIAVPHNATVVPTEPSPNKTKAFPQ